MEKQIENKKTNTIKPESRSKRVFIIVLDSFGIGGAPDAYLYGDEGSDTLNAVRNLKEFDCPNLKKLGLFDIDGVGGGTGNPLGCYCRLIELSKGKDTTTGHREIAGLVSDKAFPVYPHGFPKEIIEKFEKLTGRKTLCNKPYSGTEVIKDFGEQSKNEHALIVYTSADSVFQIAAHESVISPEELYSYCRVARELLSGENGVDRVIARPFAGEYPFYRTPRRHDFALPPERDTLLDLLSRAGYDVISVGKIADIFAGRGITERVAAANNAEGMDAALSLAARNFNGLCFINLVDFDMLYGHRNDSAGYARALTSFDQKLGEFLPLLQKNDLLIITADHGCDPSTPSTDHSRECVPMIAFGKNFKSGVNLATRKGFCDISATVAEYFGVDQAKTQGASFLKEIEKR